MGDITERTVPARAGSPDAVQLWHWDVPSSYDAVRALRREVVHNWHERSGDSDTNGLEVSLSELLTNAVRHAGTQGPLSLTVGDTGHGLLLEIFDALPTPPRRRTADRFATSGRGLAIVERISSSMGWFPVPGDGKCVWAEIPVTGAGTGLADG